MGGKYRLRDALASLAPLVDYSKLVDPFVGGGSTLHIFGRVPFVAADTNADLVNFHNVCRDRPTDLYDAATALPDDRSTYYRIREEKTSTDPFEQATRFLYLNRTAYGGMFRVNRDGRFNVPYGGGGRLNVRGLRQSMIRHSEAVARGHVTVGDYKELCETASSGDLVFIDPPYSAPGETTFNRYAQNPFGPADHSELARIMRLKSLAGVPIIATLPANEHLLSKFDGWRLTAHVITRSMPRGEVMIVNAVSKWRQLGRVVPDSEEKVASLLAELRQRTRV